MTSCSLAVRALAVASKCSHSHGKSEQQMAPVAIPMASKYSSYHGNFKEQMAPVAIRMASKCSLSYGKSEQQMAPLLAGIQLQYRSLKSLHQLKAPALD